MEDKQDLHEIHPTYNLYVCPSCLSTKLELEIAATTTEPVGESASVRVPTFACALVEEKRWPLERMSSVLRLGIVRVVAVLS